MKLVIQIPCYNEEGTIAVTLAALPRDLPGFECVEWLIVDDGCTDRTVEIAVEKGADHVVRHPRNQGLAKAFMTGLAASLEAGADIIVNTDADNQYCADDIPKLVQPILDGAAEFVVGERPISQTKHFSPIKKLLQRLGSSAVRMASTTTIPDAPSGFRAMSRDAAMRLHVFNEHTYTIETIIQAGLKNMAITSVPIRTNEDLRPSRFIKSIPNYIRRSVFTIVRIFMLYRPVVFFTVPGVVSFVTGFVFGLRFIVYYLDGRGSGHVQSLILCALLIGTGFFLCVMGLIADLLAANRKLLEEIRWRLLRMDIDRIDSVSKDARDSRE